MIRRLWHRLFGDPILHCHLQQVVLPGPPLERVIEDKALPDDTFLLLPTVVMICRKCWHLELHSTEVSEDKETITIHRLVVNASPSPCKEENDD